MIEVSDLVVLLSKFVVLRVMFRAFVNDERIVVVFGFIMMLDFIVKFCESEYLKYDRL